MSIHRILLGVLTLLILSTAASAGHISTPVMGPAGVGMTCIAVNISNRTRNATVSLIGFDGDLLRSETCRLQPDTACGVAINSNEFELFSSPHCKLEASGSNRTVATRFRLSLFGDYPNGNRLVVTAP